jgi:hypothetical protein
MREEAIAASSQFASGIFMTKLGLGTPSRALILRREIHEDVNEEFVAQGNGKVPLSL